MEVRISRIISEYYEYTRKESEEFIREGRVKLNDEIAQIGDKASITDAVMLDDVLIPLKGIFRKVSKEQASQKTNETYGRAAKEENRFSEHTNPKSSELRKGKKNFRQKRTGKLDEYDF